LGGVGLTDADQRAAKARFPDRKCFIENPRINVGFVIYTLGNQPGTLDAVWGHQIHGGGTGRAVGGEGPGYAGTYKITYYDWHGHKLVENKLEIAATGDVYDLTWTSDGVIVTRGIGRETPSGLIAGIRFLPD
jgi:hypothetical protein